MFHYISSKVKKLKIIIEYDKEETENGYHDLVLSVSAHFNYYVREDHAEMIKQIVLKAYDYVFAQMIKSIMDERENFINRIEMSDHERKEKEYRNSVKKLSKIIKDEKIFNCWNLAELSNSIR